MCCRSFSFRDKQISRDDGKKNKGQAVYGEAHHRQVLQVVM